jgi:NAD(P)H-nitrite reductase large subunit/sulfur carrier protein ThiS
MESLAARGVDLTVVEMGDRMVPRMMGPVAGGMIRDWCEHKGVHVRTGARVEAIVPGEAGQPLSVRLSTGEKIEADLVISATGVKPAIQFLEGSGIRCLQGVLTDEHLQSSVPGIYAAGDCAEAFDKVSGRTIVSAIQPNAAEQARVAALNMLGQTTALKGVTQINVLDTLGLISTSFGQWQGVPGGQHVELTDQDARGHGRHLSLQFDGDLMVGCNSVGWTDHVGVMRGLVEGQIRLGDWKDRLLQDPTLLVEAYLACAQGQGQITLKLFATLTDYLPDAARRDNRVELTLAEGTTVAQAYAPYGLPDKLVHLVLVNGRYIPPEARATHALVHDDVLAIWPPIAGG